MKRRQLVVILVSILVIILILAGILVKISPKARYEREYSKFKDLYTEKLYLGYDLSEAENVAKNAKEAFEKGEYENAIKYIDEAIFALERAKKVIPLQLPTLWTSEQYMGYFIQDYINPQIPSVTKEQMQLVINDETRRQKLLLGLKNAHEYYDNKREETVKSGLIDEEEGRVLEVMDNIIGSITQLRRDIDIKSADVNVIYSDYNKFRSSVIQEYQLQQELRKKYLEPRYDAFIQKYMPKEYHPIKFGVFSDAASYYWNPKTLPLEDIIKEINLLSETGVDMIRLDMAYDHFYYNDTNTINKIDVAVQQIRKNNDKVYIFVYGFQKWTEGEPTDFETWKETIRDQLDIIVPRYKPDYVGIAEEPYAWTKECIKEEVSVNEWMTAIFMLADEIKRFSPNTKVATTICCADPIELFQGLMSIKNMNIVGINHYASPTWFEKCVDAFIPYWDRSKELWIGGTWDDWTGKYYDPLADKWIIGTVYYAQSKGFDGYVLYFGKNLHTANFEKSPAFYAYKDLIDEVHGNAKN